MQRLLAVSLAGLKKNDLIFLRQAYTDPTIIK
jgi:hypothetical protein